MGMLAGTYSAVVVDTNDPAGAGRVRLYVPQVHGEAVTGWAVPASQGSPLPGDQVVMAYAGADVNYPLFWPSQPLVSSVNGRLGAVVLGAGDVGAIPVPGPWTTLPLVSGYVSNSPLPQYRTVGTMVQLRGEIKPSSGTFPGGLSGTQIATLPAGAAPAVLQVFACACGTNAGGFMVRFNVSTSGGVLLYTVSGQVPAWVAVDGILVSTV